MGIFYSLTRMFETKRKITVYDHILTKFATNVVYLQYPVNEFPQEIQYRNFVWLVLQLLPKISYPHEIFIYIYVYVYAYVSVYVYVYA